LVRQSSDLETDWRQWRRVVVEYYQDSLRDYRRVWTDDDSLGIHIGYWDKSTRDHAESLNNMNREMARRVRLSRGETVLDAGCGIGGPALWLAANVGVSVLGINVDPNQLSVARKFAFDRRLADRVRFVQQDYHELGFAESVFDVVWIEEALCYSCDKSQFFGEAFRVLKPGGRLVIEEGMRLDRPYTARWERFLQKLRLGWALPDIATRDEYRRMLTVAGFEGIVIDDVSDAVKRSARRMYAIATLVYPLVLLRHPLRRLKEFVRAVSRRPNSDDVLSNIRYRNIRTARLQWRAYRSGLFILAIVTAVRPERLTSSA
jgi:tocopherol O-methyltransferase